MPPSVTIVRPDHVWHQRPASFTAAASDSDGGPVRLTWAWEPDRCSATPPPAGARSAATVFPDSGFVVPATTTAAPFCLWAIATDRYGATSATPMLIEPEDHPAVAVIDVVRPTSPQPFPLYGEVALSAASSHDEDPVDDAQKTFAWQLTPLDATPGAPMALAGVALLPCAGDEGLPDKTMCFSPQMPGRYKATLSVQVPGADPVSTERTLVVAADRLPCITDTTPSLTESKLVYVFKDPSLATTSFLNFSVNRVSDDGDPFPPTAGGTGPRFRWFVGQGTDPLAYRVDDQLEVFGLFPLMYLPGDVVRVRVEVVDRNPAPAEAILAGCRDTDPLCAASPGCYLWKTWTVQFQ